MKHYEAPWSASLIAMSVLTTVVCLGVAGGAWFGLTANHAHGTFGWAVLLPLAILVGAALLTTQALDSSFR
jgi:hypothetical protein